MSDELTQHLIATYNAMGFIVIRQFLNTDELAELSGEIDRFMRHVAPALDEDQAFYQEEPDGSRALRQVHRMHCDPFFSAYQRNPKWSLIAQDLIGEPVTPHPPWWFNKPPRTAFATPPHQDNSAFNYSPPKAIMLLVAIDPMTVENGCLRYLPGSHRSGLREHAFSDVRGFALEVCEYGEDDRAREVVVELEGGDLVCHHPLVVHRADANPSNQRRSAFGIAYRGDSADVDWPARETYERAAAQARA